MLWLVGFVCVCVCVCAFVCVCVSVCLRPPHQFWPKQNWSGKKWLLACLQGRGWGGGEIDAKHWLDKSGRHTCVQECQLQCDLWFRTYTEDHIATRFRYRIFAYTNCHKVQIRRVMELHSHKVQVRTELQSCTVIKFRSGPKYGAVQSSSSGQDSHGAAAINFMSGQSHGAAQS